ncbi:hypothetical protein POVCU1_018430 [Plasmodium ovale curtisi]|uniref:Uncharacterized protein n=1 Tax=Plasmodium ovale curtisi TaxID=864141 RepID=A0A1A8WEK4_PLAOA|nr:hypothetical protein POVCU1_018430 [Plasmodium ovale curtisi]
MKNMLNYRTFVNNANTELLIKINGERSRSSSPTQHEANFAREEPSGRGALPTASGAALEGVPTTKLR